MTYPVRSIQPPFRIGDGREEEESFSDEPLLAMTSLLIAAEMEQIVYEGRRKEPCSLQQAMREMMLRIESCKIDFVQLSAKRADYHVEIDQHALDLLAEQHKDLMKELSKMHKKQKEARRWHIVTKVFQAVTAIAGIAITACTAGLATAAIMGAVVALQLSGGLQALSQQISKGLVSAGMDEGAADFLANTIVVISVALVVGGVGAGINASSLASVPVGALTGVIALQTAAALGFLPSLIQAIPGDEEAKKWTSLAFGMVESIVTALISYRVTMGFAGPSAVSGQWREILQMIGVTGNFVGGIGNAVGQFGEGVSNLQLAEIAKRRGAQEAAVTLVSGVSELNSSGMRAENQHRQAMMGFFEGMTGNYSEFAKVYQALSRILSK